MGKGLVGFGVVSLRNVQNRSYPGGVLPIIAIREGSATKGYLF